MWVRVTHFGLEGEGGITADEVRLELERSDEAIRRNVADNCPDWRGHQYMLDRAARRTLALTYWQSEDDMWASEPKHSLIRQPGLPSLTIETTDRFEIIAAHEPGYR